MGIVAFVGRFDDSNPMPGAKLAEVVRRFGYKYHAPLGSEARLTSVAETMRTGCALTATHTPINLATSGTWRCSVPISIARRSRSSSLRSCANSRPSRGRTRLSSCLWHDLKMPALLICWINCPKGWLLLRTVRGIGPDRRAVQLAECDRSAPTRPPPLRPLPFGRGRAHNSA